MNRLPSRSYPIEYKGFFSMERPGTLERAEWPGPDRMRNVFLFPGPRSRGPGPEGGGFPLIRRPKARMIRG